MTEWTSESSSASEPVLLPYDEHPLSSRLPRGTLRIGYVRVPLTLHVQPRATLYRLPDGRTLWCLRLWEFDRPVRRCVSTAALRRYARVERLTQLSTAIDRVLASLSGGDEPR